MLHAIYLEHICQVGDAHSMLYAIWLGSGQNRVFLVRNLVGPCLEDVSPCTLNARLVHVDAQCL